MPIYLLASDTILMPSDRDSLGVSEDVVIAASVATSVCVLSDPAASRRVSMGSAHARLRAAMRLTASALQIFSGNDILVIENIKSQATVV
jgi:hypothetical protein